MSDLTSCDFVGDYGCSDTGCARCHAVDATSKRPPYGETGAPFDLDSARRLLARVEHRPPDQVTEDRLWVELRQACDEVERLRPSTFGRPQDPPITPDYAEHLVDLAEGATDGLWVNPDVLWHLLEVYRAACSAMDRWSGHHDAMDAVHDAIRCSASNEEVDALTAAVDPAKDAFMTALGGIEAAVDRARAGR